MRLRRETRIAAAAGTGIRPATKWTLPDGRPYFVSTKTTNGYLLHFDELADFFVDHSGSEVVYSPQPNVSSDSVRHLILDSVIALALSLRGHPVFHASAIVTPFGACAFAAESGIGKSTLAATFQQAGCPILTDDCLLVESDGGGCVYGVPSYPGVRLRQDSLSLIRAPHSETRSVAHYNSKRRLRAGLFATRRHRLSAFYCLERFSGDDQALSQPRIETVSGPDRLLVALRYLFCLDAHDPDMLVRQFKMLEHLVSALRILRLIIPDGFSALQSVRDAVISDMEAHLQSDAAELD